MFLSLVTVFLIAVTGETLLAAGGSIHGVVLNGSRAGEPIADAEVQLRAGADGSLEPVASTTTDVYGKYAFQDLPLDPTIVYLPGANRDGVHYPGARTSVDPDNRIAHVRIVAFDAVHSPSPLVALHHDMDITIDERMLKVTETLIVSNPSHTTYVGESHADAPPMSLRLSIPESFDRVTFEREFFGRRFRVADHRVVTDLPWPPEDKELKFTYQVPLKQIAGVFRRPLDLPCSNLSLQVQGKGDQTLACNLPRQTSAGAETVVFASTDKQLPSGYTIELTIGNVPFPWLSYARWSAVAVLCSLIFGTVVAYRVRTNTQPVRPTRSLRRTA
jgi:hypothetical protein